MTENVNGTTAGQDEDFYDDATSAFPSVEDLAPQDGMGEGRLVAIWAKSNGTAVSATSGKPYGYTETLTLVLDDGPDGGVYTELIPSTGGGDEPARLELRHSTTGIHSRLRPRVEGKHSKTGVPLRWRPMLGRVNTQASKANKKVPAYSISEPTDSDRELIQRHKALIVSINQELEKAESEAADAAPFE